MVKASITLLMVIICCDCLSQPTAKIVCDKQYSIPVEGATVKFDNGAMTTTDRTGKFTLPSGASVNTADISHISYVPARAQVGIGTSDTIYLEPQYYAIDSIFVTPKKTKRIGYTAERDNHYGMLYTNGNEIAQKIKIARPSSDVLDFRCRILEMNADSLLLKLSFYNITQGNPGRKITGQQILVMVHKGDDKISVDLTPYDITAMDDFIVSLQIAKVYGNADKPYLKVPCQVDLAGQTFVRSQYSGWNKKRGGALGFNLLTAFQ